MVTRRGDGDARAWALAAVCAGALGCSIVNRIDACETPLGSDFQVNRLPADDQYITGPQGAVRLPTGQVAVVWNSDRVRTSTNGVPPNPGTVRAGLVQPDGRIMTPCLNRDGEVQVNATNDLRTRHPVVATGEAPGSPVYVAWTQGALDGPTRVFVRVLNAQLCNLISNETSTFEISEDRDATGGGDFGAFRPTLAVSRDGTRALIAYLVSRPTALGYEIKFRPLSVSMATSVSGRLEPNPVNGANAPGPLAAVGPYGLPRMASLSDGFAIVWPDFTAGRWQARWRIMDRLGAPDEVRTTELGGEADRNILPNLALAVDGDELVLAWDRLRSSSPRRRDVVFQRFSRALSPITAAVVASVGTGDFNVPALAALPRGAVMVSWDDDSRGSSSTDVFGRVFSRDGAALFNAASCDDGAFRLSTLAPDRRTTSALVTNGGRVAALYGDSSETSPDTFGLAVRGRSFVIADLVPALR